MKKVKHRIIQVILRDEKLIKKFDKFVKDEKRSEANAGEIIFDKFLNGK